MPTLDDVLRDALREATPAPDPDDVYGALGSRRRRRAARRAVGRAALAGAIVAASAVGVLALAREADDAPTRPSPAASDPADPAPAISLDDLCDLRSLEGIRVGPGLPTATAWTGRRIGGDGSCPDELKVETHLVADVDGDGALDGSLEVDGCLFCAPHDAIDLDGDGGEEVIVLLQGSATPTYGVYGLLPQERLPSDAQGAAGVRALAVAPPGHAAGGFPAGEPIVLTAGGDEGFSAAVSCEGPASHPVIVAAWSDHPVEGPGSEIAEVHVTRLRLEDDGAFHVLDARDLEQPADRPLPNEGAPRDSCGVAFGI